MLSMLGKMAHSELRKRRIKELCLELEVMTRVGWEAVAR
jgi:hypothetical protein